MAERDWWEDMSPGDCLKDGTWEDMANYIQHSACTDFTIYSECTDTNPVFKFGGNNDIEFDGDRAIMIDDDETYIGHGAGDNIIAGSGINNTLIGHDAGNDLTTGDNNVLVGFETMDAEADVDNCVFVGYQAGKANTQNNIIGIGYQALDNNTGYYNIGIGYQALTNNSGMCNVAMGYQAMDAAGAGELCTAIGYQALTDNTNGNSNSAFGYHALQKITTGNYNTAVGKQAGGNTATGIGNCIFIGFQAGYANTVSNRLYINSSNSAFPLIYGEFDNDALKFGDNNSYWFAQILHENGGGQLFLKECTTPTAQANYGAIYTKNDDKLYFQDGAGNEHEIALVP